MRAVKTHFLPRIPIFLKWHVAPPAEGGKCINSLGVVEGWVMAVAMMQPGRKQRAFSHILRAGVAGLWGSGEGLFHASIQTQVTNI